METAEIVKIAVSAAPYSIDKPYDYWAPEALQLAPGMRVKLPFGKGNRVCEGMVLQIIPGERGGLKEIIARLDDTPVLSEKMLHLAAFLRQRYYCTFYDALHAILPAGCPLPPCRSNRCTSCGATSPTQLRSPSAKGCTKATSHCTCATLSARWG